MNEITDDHMNIYYFGCWRDVGHYLRDTAGRTIWKEEEIGLPFSIYRLDTGFLPKSERGSSEQPEGVLHHTIEQGWTVIAFWDRSVDTRRGGNSAFVMHGEHTAEEALRMAWREFPTIFARFTFEVG